MKQDPEASAGYKPRYKSDLILEYIKVLAWPGMTLLIFVIFWGPLHQVAKMAPSLLDRSESIKIGSLSLVIGKDLAKELAIPDDVRQVLRSLSPDEIDDLLG